MIFFIGLGTLSRARPSPYFDLSALIRLTS